LADAAGVVTHPVGQAAPVLVLGATGATGRFLLPRLKQTGAPVIAVSRRVPGDAVGPGVTWLQQDLTHETARVQAHVLLSAGPLKLALRQAERMPGVQRVVALSSASVRFKQRSPDAGERRAIAELVDDEQRLAGFGERRGIAVTLLRPTLIYGGAGPSAITPVADWLARRDWAPVAGRGLRQPVHAEDLAEAMLRAAARDESGTETYELGGGETLTYPDFIRRIASAHGRDVRIVRVPAMLVGPALRLAHAFGRLAAITPAMVARQRMDLVVDDSAARSTLGWNPRPFRPGGTA
jgi:nucleoside-diphosphate-sugar epimerase